MADVKISELTAQASASVDVSADVLALVDTSVPQTKKISVENLLSPITIDKSAGTITSLGTIAGNVVINKASNPTYLQIGSSLADDPYMVFQTDGNTFAMGIDRSDSNRFKISDNATLGTNDRFEIDATGLNIFKYEGAENTIQIHSGIGSNTTGVSQIYFSSKDEHGGNTHQSYIKSTIDGGSSTSATKMSFHNRDSGGTVQEYLTIKADGKVGIGGTSPASLLHVKTTADASETIRIQNDDSLTTMGVSSDGYSFHTYQHSWYWASWDGSTWSTKARLDSNGNFGLGTSSINSNAKMHIRNGDSGQTSSSNNTQLTVENSGNAGIQLLTGTTSVGGFWIGDSNGAENGGKLYYSNNDDSWSFYNAGSVNSLILNSNGSASFAAAISTPKGVGYVVHNVTVGPGSTSTYNLNGMGGNCAIGLYAAACMREGNTTANNTTHIGVHQHTQGSNTYSDLLTRTDNSDSTIVRSGGNLTCTNNETSVNLKFIVKYFNLISLDTSNNLA